MMCLGLSETFNCEWIELGSEAMEMESNLVMKNQKLEASGILRKALIIPARNIKFLTFTILTSLPLFCFLIYYESHLQKIMVETLKTLNLPPREAGMNRYLTYFRLSWSIPVEVSRKLNQDFPNELFYLGFLFVVPLHLLHFVTAIPIVYLGSKIHTEESPVMTIREMVKKTFDKTRLKGTFVTFSYVLVLSSYTLLGLTWLGITYYAVFRNFNDFDALFYAVLCWPVFVGALVMYLAWSSVWNVSVVISILDGAGGIKPFGQAIYLSSGCEWRGFSLMLIFFFWEISLRLPCLYSGCYKSRNYFGGIIAQVCLFCFGNVLKWTVCMIYFYDCKNRAVEKKLKMQAKKRGESSG
ncbi:unnamed protein product [Malus baccata var. baccata]